MLVIVSPLFAVANAYGAGLTDFDMSSIYGTVRLLAHFTLPDTYIYNYVCVNVVPMGRATDY